MALITKNNYPFSVEISSTITTKINSRTKRFHGLSAFTHHMISKRCEHLSASPILNTSVVQYKACGEALGRFSRSDISRPIRPHTRDAMAWGPAEVVNHLVLYASTAYRARRLYECMGYSRHRAYTDSQRGRSKSLFSHCFLAFAKFSTATRQAQCPGCPVISRALAADI